MMVKNHQSYNTSTLNDLYSQLRRHESEVNEMMEESTLSLGGPLALVSKVSEKEVVGKVDSDDEEGFIMNTDDEAIAFYSNNKVKKFFKKPFNPKLKISDEKGTSVNKAIEKRRRRLRRVKGRLLR